MSARWAGLPRPFELFVRAQTQLVKIGPFRRRAFAEGLSALDRLLAELDVRDPAEIESARRERCLATWIRRTRRHYMRLPASRQAAWLKLADDVEATLRPGALLVGSHFGGGLLTPLALARLGIEILAIVQRPSPTGSRLRFIRALDLGKESAARALLEGLATLRRGGVVFLAGDLTSGRPDGDVEVDVLGRRRRFSRAFAELSVTSSIPPTPVFSRVDERGRIFTWVEPALTSGCTGDREARVAELVRSYARVLSATFARYPGNVPPPAIRAHFDSPKVEMPAR